MNTATVENHKQKTGEYKEFEGLMDEVATLKPQQQERLNYFLRGYVTAAQYLNEKDRAAIQ